MALPPYPAIRNARMDIETSPNSGNFVEITARLQNIQFRYGADNPEGILSITAAGSMFARTYDPNRELDPSNASSPHAAYLRPGTRIRIWSSGMLLRLGYIDTIEYDFKSKQGEISGSDSIALMAAARLMPGYDTNPATPGNLKSRADYFISEASLNIPTHVVGSDPPVTTALPDEQSVLTQILTSALDVLYAAWIDRDGVLRFRSFGERNETGLVFGGGGIPIENVRVVSSMQGIYSRVVAYDTGGTGYEVAEAGAVQRHGTIIFRREHPVYYPQDWAAAVVLDRSSAYRQFVVGKVRIQTETQLNDLAWLGLGDKVQVWINSTSPTFSSWVWVAGLRFEANIDSGWSLEFTASEPRYEFDYPPVMAETQPT